MKERFLEYRGALAYNRSVFMVEHGDLFKAFVAIDRNFSTLIEPLRTRRDSDGKSHVSEALFILLLQRQAYAAFDALCADQSYQAWLLLRPGLEGALIIGKWVDDPQNAKIWENRRKDRDAYAKAYTGKSLCSASLPGSERIRGVLGTINDRFVHANLDYYRRHLKVDEGDPGYVNLSITYCEDDTLQVVNVLAFLHLVLVLQEALLTLFNHLFNTSSTLPLSVAAFRRTFTKRIEELAQANPEYHIVMSELGAWGEHA